MALSAVDRTLLSGAAADDGVAIPIGTSSGSPTTIHTAVAGTTHVDDVHIEFINTNTTAIDTNTITVTLKIGASRTRSIELAPQQRQRERIHVRNGVVIAAYADADGVQVEGFVNPVARS